jgi:hypothetical protein
MSDTDQHLQSMDHNITILNSLLEYWLEDTMEIEIPLNN